MVIRERAIGAVIRDERGRLLLIRRGRPPGAGRWSIPGGRVEPGESDAAALVREVREETGLVVEPGRLVGELDIPNPERDVVYAVADYVATVIGGELRAGDDAADAAWYDPTELARLPLTDNLLEFLIDYGVVNEPNPRRS